MIRRYTAILALIVSAILFLPATLFAKGAVIGYAAGWMPAPTAAQLDRVTHVMVFQLIPNTDGTLRTTDVPSWLTGNNTFRNMARDKGVLVSIAVGGGGASANFTSATNNTNRANFVNNIKNYVDQYNLDGVDVDWEFPVGDAQWGQCMSLLEDLKAAMPCKRISIAMGGDSPNPQFTNHFNITDKSIVQKRIWAADAVHLMTYDMQGVTRPFNWATHSDVAASRGCIDAWATFGNGQSGFSKEKLMIGCAFYGYNSATGWTMVQFKDGGGVGCDNATTLGQKMNYTHDNEYGGAIIWELSYDLNISATPTLLSALWSANETKGGYSIITINTHPEEYTVFNPGGISGNLSVVASTMEGCVNQLTYQWYSNTTDSNTGGTQVNGATGASFTIPTTLTEGFHYYYCVVKTSRSKVNPVTSNVATVRVSSTITIPVVTIDEHPVSTTVRQNNISGNLQVSASVTEGATPKYQWYSNTTNSNVGGTAILNATNAVFAIPTSLTAGTYYYFCEVGATGGAPSVRSNVATVTVEPPIIPIITIYTHPAPLTIFVRNSGVSGTLSVSASVTENATLSYQWYSNTTNSNVGGTVVANATGADFVIPTNLNQGTYYYFCEVRATNGATSVRSSVSTVTVLNNANTTFITINKQPDALTTVTQGSISGSLTVDATVNRGATLIYQWYSNTTNSSTGGTAIANETGASFTIPTNLAAGTYYYYCLLRATGATDMPTVVATVTVEPSGTTPPVITINTQPASSTTFTEGSISGSLTISASATQGATVSYQWYRNTTNSNTGGTIESGATNASFPIPTTLTAGTYYYYCVVSATGGATSVLSNVAVITVNSITLEAPSITTYTVPACTVGEMYNVAITFTGSLPMTWTLASGDLPAGLTLNPTTGVISGVPEPGAWNGGTGYSFTVQATNGAGSDSQSFWMGINQATGNVPVITINTQPAASTTFTEGSISGSLTISASATQGATVSYQWYRNITNSNTGGTIESGATNASFTIPTTLTEGTYYYYCVVSATGGATSVASNVASISVTDCKPTAGITNNTGTTVLTCTTPSISLNATGGVSYSWDNGLGNNANATVTAPGTYTVTVTAANGCSATASITITENKTPPTAGITNNTGLTELTCTLLSINLTATGGVSYTWDNGLGNNANAAVTSAGTYTVTVTGANGCTATQSITITSDKGDVIAGITNNTGETVLTCTTPSISLTATGNGTYSWSNGLGSNANVNVTASGTYTVTVTATNGCSDSQSITITEDKTPPAAGITNNTATTVLTCTTTSISLTATGGGTYSWSNGLGSNANVTINTAGTYVATVTGSNGCFATSSVTITENTTPPTAGITNNAGTTVLTCTTPTISLTATGGGTYVWSNGLGNNANATVTSAGTYTVTVTAANGCTNTASITITENKAAPTAGITNNSPTTELTCSTPSITLTATGNGTYAWSNGLGSNATVNITSAGTYTVTVTGANGCTNTANITITADASVLTVNFDSNGGSEVLNKTTCPGNTITKPSPDPTRLGYNFAEWYLGANIFNFSTPITATITLRAEWNIITYNIIYVLDGGVNHLDNPSTYTVENQHILLQDPTKENYIFLGWSEGNEIPAGSTETKTFTAQWRHITGVPEVSAIAAIQAYPNPVATELHIKLPVKGTTDYVIFNQTGQTVLQGKLQDNSTINVQSLPGGIYYLRISGETVKVIKN